MLPLHRVPTADGTRLSRTTKGGALLGRPTLRWIGLFIVLFFSYILLAPGYVEIQEWFLPEQPPSSHPEIPNEKPLPTLIWKSRQEQVRKAFVHALTGYQAHAFPNDELRSVTGGGSNKFNGWGVTLFDSLDTMWILGLHEEFSEAIGFVAKQSFNTKLSRSVPFFETTIRYLGGLLSAYALSQEPVLLARADDLGSALLPVFNGTLSGLPAYSVDLYSGTANLQMVYKKVLFAEATSCQLEFKYLAKLTGRAKYYEAAEKVMEMMYEAPVLEGLFPDQWNSDGTSFGAHLTIGSGADSGYEYLLKQWLIMGDQKAHTQYLISVEGIINNLLYITPKRGLLYVTDIVFEKPTHTLEHLSCFLPGMLALGAHMLDLSPSIKERHQWAAQGLAYTCWLTYADQETGLGPDVMRMVAGEKWVDRLTRWEEDGRPGGVPPGLSEPQPEPNIPERDYMYNMPLYLLRPETVESLFIMWKTTGDVRWRERGYDIFAAIEKHARTEYGYASVGSVSYPPYTLIDDMPSYFLAETLKYLFLLFDDNDILPLSKWVFNTEAHPLPVFKWTDWELKAFNISIP